MSYPDFCIRGIINDTFVLDGVYAAPPLFNFINVTSRTDNNNELSINWEDNDGVVEFTLNQKKTDGTIKFKTGIAKVPISAIDNLNSQLHNNRTLTL